MVLTVAADAMLLILLTVASAGRSLYILFSYCSTFLTIQFMSMPLCCVRLLNHVLLAGDEQDSGEG